jgi:hypothetical protein
VEDVAGHSEESFWRQRNSTNPFVIKAINGRKTHGQTTIEPPADEHSETNSGAGICVHFSGNVTRGGVILQLARLSAPPTTMV